MKFVAQFKNLQNIVIQPTGVELKFTVMLTVMVTVMLLLIGPFVMALVHDQLHGFYQQVYERVRCDLGYLLVSSNSK